MRIKEILKEKNITVQELADKMGVSRQALSKQIGGKLLVETAQKIADALGVPIAELFEKRPDSVLVCPHCGKEINIKLQ